MFNYGTVNVNNIQEVADRLRELLTGKKYTTVHCYEYRQWEPEVRLHQELGGSRDGDDVNLHFRESGLAQVVICDSYGVGGFCTTRTEPSYDPEFNAPYVRFEKRGNGQFHITHRMPNGLLCKAVYAVEDSIARQD